MTEPNPMWVSCRCNEMAYRCRCGMPPTNTGGALLVAVDLPSGRRVGLPMVTGMVKPDPDDAPIMAWVAEKRRAGHARWYAYEHEVEAFDGLGVGVGRIVSWQRIRPRKSLVACPCGWDGFLDPPEDCQACSGRLKSDA